MIATCPSCGTKNRVPDETSGRPQCARCQTALPWVAQATDASFGAVVDTTQLVLLDLWAPWCGPCRMVAPVLEQLATQYAGRVKVVKVNVDDNPATAQRFGAQSIPLLVFLRGGTEVDRVVGAQPHASLAARVDALLVR